MTHSLSDARENKGVRIIDRWWAGDVVIYIQPTEHSIWTTKNILIVLWSYQDERFSAANEPYQELLEDAGATIPA